jgi:hypothetical protein
MPVKPTSALVQQFPHPLKTGFGPWGNTCWNKIDNLATIVGQNIWWNVCD